MNKKDLLDKYISQSVLTIVGWGYIDIIVHREKLTSFVAKLSGLEIKIKATTYWSYCTPENFGICPREGGGPVFDLGFLSELNHDYKEFKSDFGLTESHNRKVHDAIMDYQFYLSENSQVSYQDCDCFHVGLWLDVPDNWRNDF